MSRHDWDEVFRLDDGPGPALPFDNFASERMVQEVLGKLNRPQRRTIPWAAAATLVLFLLPTGVWAAFHVSDWLATAKIDAKPASGFKTNPRHEELLPNREGESAAEPSADQAAIPPTKPAPQRTVAQTTVASTKKPTSRSTPPMPPPKVMGSQSKTRALPRASLHQAAELRRRRQWRKAANMYAQLRRNAPSSMTMHIAAVAEGQIRLEHLGQPAAAQLAFRAAQEAANEGPLAAEAMLGEAESLGQLSQPTQAERVYRALIGRFPRTKPAETARQRLDALKVPQ